MNFSGNIRQTVEWKQYVRGGEDVDGTKRDNVGWLSKIQIKERRKSPK